MKPILYEKSGSDYTKNGIGVLSDVIEDEVSKELNGIYECSFIYPVKGQFYSEILPDRIIKVKADETSNPQLFRIDRHTKEINGKVKFYAKHISYDLNKNTVTPFTITNANAAAALTAMLNSAVYSNHGFTVYSDITDTGNITVDRPQSMRAVIGGMENSILDVYGGELEFDNYTVKLHSALGNDNGVKIAYGKNLVGLTDDKDITGVYTAIQPYAFDEDGNLITLTEKIIELSSASSYGEPRVKAVDLSSLFDTSIEDVTEEELRTRATAYLSENPIDVPSQNLEINFVSLYQSKEYAQIANLERISLGDWVTVENPQMGVSVKAKCVKTVYDFVAERYKKIELGQVKNSITSTLSKSSSVVQKLEKESEQSESITKQIIREQTNTIISGHDGHIYTATNDDGTLSEVFLMDTDNPATATTVFRANYAGLGFSRTGVNGPYISAWTLEDGGKFNASFIKAGSLDAQYIKTGTLSDTNGTTSLNLANGKINIASNNNGDLELWSNGVTIYHSDNTVATSMFLSASDHGVLTAQDILVGTRDYEKTYIGVNALNKGYVQTDVIILSNGNLSNVNGYIYSDVSLQSVGFSVSDSNNAEHGAFYCSAQNKSVLDTDYVYTTNLRIGTSNLNGSAEYSNGYIMWSIPLATEHGYSLRDGSTEVGSFYKNISNEAVLKTDAIISGGRTYAPTQVNIGGTNYYIFAAT